MFQNQFEVCFGIIVMLEHLDGSDTAPKAWFCHLHAQVLVPRSESLMLIPSHILFSLHNKIEENVSLLTINHLSTKH